MITKKLTSAWTIAAAIVASVAFSSVSLAQYQDETIGTGCGCNTATVGRLTGADFSQDAAWQDTQWGLFRTANTGIVDTDRVSNATKTYNCHSYAFNGSDRWLNSGAGALDEFFGTATGCWTQDSAGTVKSGSAHSMLVADNQGKCGNGFVCKNNQYVYKGDTPTTVYKKL